MKIYIIEKSTTYLGFSSTPIHAFKEEIDAILYKEELENKKDANSVFYMSSTFYSIKEIEFVEYPERDMKKVKKWADKKVKELDREMLENATRQDAENKTLVEENEKLALRKKEFSKYL